MVKTAEQKKKDRMQKAIATGKSYRPCGEASRELWKAIQAGKAEVNAAVTAGNAELRETTAAGQANLAATGRQQQKIVQQTAYRAVKRVEQAGDKEREKMREYARAMAALVVEEAQTPAATDAAATSATEPAPPEPVAPEPVAPEPAPEPFGPPAVLGSDMTTLALQTSELDLEDDEDMEASSPRSALKERCTLLVRAKDAEAARIKPQLEKDVGETLDRLSKEHEWPANDQFRKQILFRVERFFVKNPFLKDLQERLVKAEDSPHLSRKRKACFDCRQLDPFDYKSPIMPCGAHSVLTGEEHAQFEAKLRTEWAERAILQAADGLRDTLKGQAEQEAKRKKWMAAEKAKEQQADHEFEAECKARRMLFATTRRCVECKAAELGELCERHQAELVKLRDELLEPYALVR
jgi:hypothetical protein